LEIYIFGAAPASAAKLLFLPFFLIFLNPVLEPVASKSLVRRNWFVVTDSFQLACK
jgi:hypothetical protein